MSRQDICGGRRGIGLLLLCLFALLSTVFLARATATAKWSPLERGARYLTAPVAERDNTFSLAASDPVTVYLPLVTRCYDGTVPPFGITMYGSIDDDAGLQEMQELRLSWVTTFVSWSDVEPDPPTNGTHTYDWSIHDTKFTNAAAAGFRPIALIGGNPAWAAEYPGGPVTDTNHLKAFLGALIERYDGDGFADAPGSVRVRHWMLYPEPDNGDEERAPAGKGYWGHNGAGFSQMLAEVQPVMKAADPGAKIMIGGLAYDWFEDQGGPFVRSFLPDVLEAGGGEYLDMVAIHYYPIFWSTISAKMQDVKSTLNSYGYGDLPMICPEMGYWSDPAAGSSEEKQARRLVKMFVRGMSVDLNIMTWYAVFDHGDGTEAHGLLNPDHTPKPAYTAYTVLVSELTGARYNRTEYPEVEGYVFSTECDTREKDVLWTNPVEGGEVTRDLSFPVSALRVVQKEGEESIIYDGGPGDLDDTPDGRVTIRITGSPVYVEEYP